MQNSISPHNLLQNNTIQLKSARGSPIRFLLLFLIIIVAFVNQYSFNNPQPLEDTIQNILNITQSDFQWFYSLTAFPNLFTIIFIGYFCDYFGMRISIVILSGMIATCQLIVAIGGYLQSYYCILIGRFLFGIACQAVFIPQASIVSVWFKGKQQSVALGIAITFPQLGNALNSYLTPLIYEASNSLGWPLMFSFFLCIIGFCCALGVAYLDKKAQIEDKMNSIVVISQNQQQNQQINFSDIKKLKKQFWIIVFICTAAFTMWIPFLDNVNRLFQKRFCFSQLSAGKAITIVYIVAACTSIPLGLTVDQYGHRRLLSMIGVIIFLLAQVLFLSYPQCSLQQQNGILVGLIFQGLGYAFYANVMVASIPLVVKSKFLGTAFGIMQLLACFFQFLIPMINGFIVQNCQRKQIGYRITSGIFVLIGIIGIFIVLLFYCFTSEKYKRRLDRSSHQIMLKKILQQQNPNLITKTSMTSNSSAPIINSQQSIAQLIDQNKQQIIQYPPLCMKKSLQKPLLSFQFQL